MSILHDRLDFLFAVPEQWSLRPAPAAHFGTGWLDCCSLLLCIVLILVLRLVSVAVLWLLCLSLVLLLSCLPLALLFSVLSSFLPFSTLSAALRVHRRFGVLHAVLKPVLLYFVLLATGLLAVALSLILSRDTLWYFTISWMPRLNTTTQHCAPRDRWLAARARAPSCSLQQRVLLTVRTGLRGRCRCGPSVVSNTTPTPLCASPGCVHPHNENLHRGLLPRRGPFVRLASLACVIDPRLSLSSDFLVTFPRYFSSCSDDFLSCVHRHLLRNVIVISVRCDCAPYS